jgi:hypothetical protein
VAFVALLLLGGCAAPGLDEEQSAAAARTCASLRERVANRTLGRLGPLLGDVPDPEEKLDDLDPRVFADDPVRWYATLEQRIGDADLGPSDEPTPVSPATRLVEGCQHLAP